jgi:SAM-dependent methyltransferase
MSPVAEFHALLEESLRDGSFVRLTLGKPRGADRTLRKILVRPVTLQGGAHLSFLHRHDTRDITKNLPLAEAVREIGRLLGSDFYSAHMFTTRRGVQLEFNKKGEPRLSYGSAAPQAADPAHDREKHRLLPAASRDWLQALGVVNADGSVRPGMADKHRQIHKFTEIISHLVAEARLPGDRPVEVADMGCGKGYLTFAVHDWFEHVHKRSCRVTGIEARSDLVELCNRVAHDTQRPKLSFIAGDIGSAQLPHLDILIALHACDTATDDALARGVQAGAALIVVAPCCQKELRPQLTPPPVFAPVLRHGIWQERHAEFATDALRALLLEWAGYNTKAFEFISTEHTAKNVMIAATKRAAPDDFAARDRHAAEIRALAAFYGIKSHALADQLRFEFT